MMLKQIISFLKTMYVTLISKIYSEKITHGDVSLLLSLHSDNYYISDNYFHTTDLQTMEKLIQLSPIKLKKYTKEKFDCDDFSFSLMGLYRLFIPNLAVGIVWSKDHAYNFCICKEERGIGLYYIEPQTNKITKARSEKQRLMVI